MKKRLAIVVDHTEGYITPVSVLYGEVFFGADSIAIFESYENIKFYLKKALKKRKAGDKFKIINLDKKHHLPITVGRDGGPLSCKSKATIKRASLESLNGYPIKEWIQKLKKENKLRIA